MSLGSDNDQSSPTFSIFSSDEHMALTNSAENADNQVTLLNNESVSIAVKD